MFYHGDECDPDNRSMDPVLSFKPFGTFYNPGCRPASADKDYIIAQYDGAIAYMDACIQSIFTALENMGILDDTIIALNGDHARRSMTTNCGSIITASSTRIARAADHSFSGRGTGRRTRQRLQSAQRLLPTCSTWPAGGPSGNGRPPVRWRNLMSLVNGDVTSFDSEFYIRRMHWMRKHGWRTPSWKLMIALEPDFHFKPEIELFNLVEDPNEDNNLAEERPR